MNKGKEYRFYRICCNYIFPLLLLLYPLRHIHWGLDLWDTGYNYANFRYMGLEHMDPMWLFSTYLSNAVGHILTMLPGGHTLLFMNLYTGLFVSLLALLAYRFFTKRLQLPGLLVFIGEFAAISLCWCPTALLYNYLTYVLLLAGALLLYEGLVREKTGFLVLAGAALGTNLFVRFPNLLEAGLIVAVWAYGILCHKKGKQVLKETGFCVLGYGGAVLFWLGYLSLRYGLSSYVTGIKRLFAMTDTASDYKAVSMLHKLFYGYIENFYWVGRLLVFVLAGMVICMVLPAKWKKCKWAACTAIAAVAAGWLYYREFCSIRFDDYSAMHRPGILFLILTLFVCIVQVFRRQVKREEKLFAGLVMLVGLITPVGSNNGLLPGINNLFLAAPYVLWCSRRLCKTACWRIPLVWKKSRKEKAVADFGAGTLCLDLTGVKVMLGMFLGLFLFQSIGFGAGFSFVEAHGAKNVNTKVENNAILKGIYMSGERAEWLEEISSYVSGSGLKGKEVILYGNIPSLSFYLEMPSAFNPWPNLPSYSVSAMSAAIEELEEHLAAGGERPVVILNRAYVDGLQAAEMFKDDPKLQLILQFMEKYGYTETFSNNKFALYEAEKREYD